MDEELQQHLTAMESRLVELVTGVKESLEREMRSGFESVQIRLDAQGLRLERQGGLIQTGSRWTARENDWSEKIDSEMEKRTREIADLRNRMEKLEGGSH